MMGVAWPREATEGGSSTTGIADRTAKNTTSSTTRTMTTTMSFFTHHCSSYAANGRSRQSPGALCSSGLFAKVLLLSSRRVRNVLDTFHTCIVFSKYKGVFDVAIEISARVPLGGVNRKSSS